MKDQGRTSERNVQGAVIRSPESASRVFNDQSAVGLPPSFEMDGVSAFSLLRLYWLVEKRCGITENIIWFAGTATEASDLDRLGDAGKVEHILHQYPTKNSFSEVLS
jgi:hypothetical protein